MRVKILVGTLAALAVCLFGLTGAALAAPLSFEVTYDAAAGTAPVDGRIIVIAANPFYASPDWGYTEPREVVANELAQGPPFWGKTVSAMAPGATETLDTTGVYGYPLPTIAELPEGDYWVQAYLAKYTTFHRADGFTFKGFFPGGVSLDALDDPGALYSTPQMMHLTPDSGPVQLSLTQVVELPEPVPPGGTQQQGNPPTTRHVKHVKIKSDLLSSFWGQDMYIAADVLLPSGYFRKANAHRKYPVIYWTFHYPDSRETVNPGGFVEPPGVQEASPVWWMGDARFSKWWLSGEAPQVIYVQIREENPYGETAYQTDSPNVGPYDTAEKTELVPAIQERFRIYKAGWARTCFGISTGGWMAAAQQIYHPRYYAGAWVFAPDIMSFTAAVTANMYTDDNMYYTDYGWYKAWRPGTLLANHDHATTCAQENLWEAALTGPDGRVANDWTIGLSQAVWGPIGPDGYYLPAWDKLTGTIDHAVVEQMKGKDLTLYTKSNWGTIGKDLRGKLHIYVGTKDTYALDNGVLAFQTMASKLTSPRAGFDVHWVVNARHVWWPHVGPGGGLLGLVRTMARTMRDAAPTEASRWWYTSN